MGGGGTTPRRIRLSSGMSGTCRHRRSNAVVRSDESVTLVMRRADLAASPPPPPPHHPAVGRRRRRRRRMDADRPSSRRWTTTLKRYTDSKKTSIDVSNRRSALEGEIDVGIGRSFTKKKITKK